ESFKNAQFRLEFARQPKIIRVKECEEITGCLADPGIPRRTRTASAGQAEQFDSIAEHLLQRVRRAICRTVIHDYELNLHIALTQGTLDCVKNQPSAVPSRNHD